VGAKFTIAKLRGKGWRRRRRRRRRGRGGGSGGCHHFLYLYNPTFKWYYFATYL
jgi:hypothetical protein